MTEPTLHLPGSLKLPGRSLKPSWTWIKFGDVVRLNTDRVADPAAEGIERYVGLDHIEREDLRIRRWGLVADGTTFTNYFKPGQTLFGKRRAYQRKVAVADFAGVCSGDIYVFEPKDDCLLPELLPFICQTERFYEYAVGTSAGSLSPRTNWTQLAQYEFALPPLTEQRRLASLLQQTEEYLDSLLEAKVTLKSLQVSMLQNLWDTTRGRIQLGNLIIHGPQNGLYLPSKKYGLGIPIIRIDSFYDGEMVAESNWKRVDIDEGTQTTYGVSRGDIIINRVNSKEFVGKAVFVPTWAEGYVYESNMMRFKVDARKALATLVVAFINHPVVQKQVASRRKDAINQSSINQQDVKALEIPSVHLEDQKEFVAKLNSVIRQKETVKNRRSRILSIKQTILSKIG